VVAVAVEVEVVADIEVVVAVAGNWLHSFDTAIVPVIVHLRLAVNLDQINYFHRDRNRYSAPNQAEIRDSKAGINGSKSRRRRALVAAVFVKPIQDSI